MIQHDIVGHTPPISQPTAVEAYAQCLFFWGNTLTSHMRRLILLSYVATANTALA